MTIALFFLIIALMILSFIFIPTVKIKNVVFSTYWVVVLIGALLFLVLGYINFDDVKNIVLSPTSMNPAKLIVLFISMTIMSLFLNEIGFFEYLALIIVKRVKPNQATIFTTFYFLIGILTIFVSNDVIILTLTPFVIYFAKNAKINSLPYLFAVISAGNTFSNVLLIGNPTNIYLAAQQYIEFIEFLNVMFLPGLVSGLSCYVLLRIAFKKHLKTPVIAPDIEVRPINKPLAIIGLIHLISCIVLLALSNVVNMEMWLITLGFALSLVICVLVYSVKHKDKIRLLLNIFKKAPWNFIPLIISMYLLIEGLAKTNLITDLGIILSNLHPIVSYGTSSFIFANIMNNIPMSMFFSKIIATSLIGTSATMATYASIIGANLGVLLTPFGALAGLMWFQLLKQHDIHLNFKIYLKYMFIVSISVLALSLFTLYLVFGL